jgi:hypothetical protein
MEAGRKNCSGFGPAPGLNLGRSARASIQGECGLNRALLERGRFAAFQILDRPKKKIQTNESRKTIGNQILSSCVLDSQRARKTKAPQTPFRVTGRSFEQPSPEFCSIPTYSMWLSSGMALPCNMAARLCYSLEGLLALSPSPAKHDDRSCRARYR